MLKSLLNQGRQIRSSKVFTHINLGDTDSDRNSIAVGQETLEGDLNILRSMIKDITGGNLFSDKPKVTLLETEKTTSKLLIQPVQVELTGINGSSFVTSFDTNYTNTLTTTDIGYIVDDAGTPAVTTKARVTVRDKVTNAPLLDSNENKIFGVLSNDNDKIKVSFYTDVDGVATPTSINGDILVDSAIALNPSDSSKIAQNIEAAKKLVKSVEDSNVSMAAVESKITSFA